MRISDEERQRAVAELRRHCTAGRIGVDEYAERIERAVSANTLEELDALLADLPILRIADPGEREQVVPFASLAGGAFSAASRTLVSWLVVLASVFVVVAAVVLVVVVDWTWALALLIGWLVGVVQGRLHRFARRQAS
jgi:hypothetical protein